MLARIRHGLTRIGELTAHPAAFGLVALYAIAWLIFSPGTFGWGAIATLATWLMTLFITRTVHRDTQAIHAKIDELCARMAGRERNWLIWMKKTLRRSRRIARKRGRLRAIAQRVMSIDGALDQGTSDPRRPAPWDTVAVDSF